MRGADSSVPQPARYSADIRVWGIYVAGSTPHVWTHDEVAALGRAGTPLVLPIVVPTQETGLRWWTVGGETGGYEYLEGLVRQAVAWGVPPGAPLVLDVEEAQAEAMGAEAQTVAQAWVAACRAHTLVPWLYGGPALHQAVTGSIDVNRWLAEWPTPAPEDPQVPEGYKGWQYTGSDVVDDDVFAPATYLGVDLQVVPVAAAVTEAAEAKADAAETETAAAETETDADEGKAPAASLLTSARSHAAALVEALEKLAQEM